jgi:hypothetical protein
LLLVVHGDCRHEGLCNLCTSVYRPAVRVMKGTALREV